MIPSNKGRDLQRKKMITVGCIQSYEVSNEFLRLFIPYHSRDHEYLKDVKNLIPFRNNGLHHVFSKKVATDTVLQSLYEAEKNEREQLRKYFRGQEVDESFEKNIIPRLNSLGISSNVEAQEWAIKKYAGRKSRAYTEKLKEIIFSFNERYEIHINDKKINLKQLNSKYFVHPNMHEKGFMTIIPLDSLKHVENTLIIKRQRTDSTYSEVSIPFLKVN